MVLEENQSKFHRFLGSAIIGTDGIQKTRSQHIGLQFLVGGLRRVMCAWDIVGLSQ